MLHKVVGIIILALVLKRVNLSWSDIGFHRNSFCKRYLKGLLLGSVCFAISYGLNWRDFYPARQSPAHIELYISSFPLTGSQKKSYGFRFLPVMRTIFNALLKYGWRRGFFAVCLKKRSRKTKPFMQAKLYCRISIWRLAHCNANQKLYKWRNVICGNASNGYRLHDSCRIMGIKWGLLYRITGNLWAGLGDHLFNNTSCYKHAACRFTKWRRRITNCPDHGADKLFLRICVGNLLLQKTEKEIDRSLGEALKKRESIYKQFWA